MKMCLVKIGRIDELNLKTRQFSENQPRIDWHDDRFLDLQLSREKV